MISLERFLQDHVTPFTGTDYHYDQNKGFIVWRRGTGNNVELLHIRAFHPKKGSGRALVYHMLDQLKNKSPYYSVFGFTRATNSPARAFYVALGFHLTKVQGLYKEGPAMIFWQNGAVLHKRKYLYLSKTKGV